MVELIDLVNSQMTLLRWLAFLLGSMTVTLSLALLNLFPSSDVSICSKMENSDHVVSVPIDIPVNSKQDAPFHRIAYDYSRAGWHGLSDHFRDLPRENIFKLSASAAASEFCEWVKVGVDVYTPHRKYQVKLH